MKSVLKSNFRIFIDRFRPKIEDDNFYEGLLYPKLYAHLVYEIMYTYTHHKAER